MSPSRAARKPFAILLFAALLSVLYACGGKGEEPPSASSELPVVEAPARWASALGRDVGSLVEASDLVFVGVVTERAGQREEAVRDGAEPGGRGSFPVTQFAVTVERVIAGEAGGSVVVEQAGGEREGPQGRYVLRLDHDPPLEVGGRYLFFATWKENGTLTAPPFGRLPVVKGAIAEPEGWEHLGAVQGLTGLSVDGAGREVERVAQ